MRPFGTAKRRRVVVRSYGRDSLLGLVNPLLALIVRTFGLQLRLRSEDRVLLQMERDQVAMIREGYRIVASEQFEMPPFGITCTGSPTSWLIHRAPPGRVRPCRCLLSHDAGLEAQEP